MFKICCHAYASDVSILPFPILHADIDGISINLTLPIVLANTKHGLSIQVNRKSVVDIK